MPQNCSDNQLNILQSIVGEQLSSIEFVQDYIQFRFNGPCLTAYTNPVVNVGETRLEWDDVGYCDALRRCLGRKVLRAEVSSRNEIAIDIEGGARISVSLKLEDYCGVEAALFDNGAGRWMVWRADD